MLNTRRFLSCLALATGASALGCAAEAYESGAGRAQVLCSEGQCTQHPSGAPEPLGISDDLDCSADKRVVLMASTDNSVVQVRSCFYLSAADIEYPAVGDAYASVKDAAGSELDYMALPNVAKVWIENGLGGNLWFYDSAYLPDATTVDLYLRGHSTDNFTLIGSADVPGIYTSDSLDYSEEPSEPSGPYEKELELRGEGYRFERY